MPSTRATTAANKRPSRKRAAEETNQGTSKRLKQSANSTNSTKLTTKASERKRIASARPPARASGTTDKRTKAATLRKKTPATSATKKGATKAPKATTKTTAKLLPTDKKPVGRPARTKPPTLNPLTSIPRVRATAPLHALVFGNGDAGQFGLGPDIMAEIARPKLHAWVEECINKGKFAVREGQSLGLESLVAGGMHSLAIDPKGRLWSWGVNDEGALGRRVNDVPNPEKPEEMIEREELEANPGLVEGLPKDFRAVAVSGGDNVSVAIGSNGLVKAWGSFHSSAGSLGFQNTAGAERKQVTPITPPQLEKIQFSSISTGSNHVVGLTTDGRVYTWGAGEHGQLGRKIPERRMINSTRPDPLHLRKVIAVGSGAYHSFAIDAEGEVYAWGLNQYGQLGLEPEVDASGEESRVVWTPAHIPELSPSELSKDGWKDSRVVRISGGEHHTVFLLSDGRVFAAGRIDSSQLGLHSDHPHLKEAKAADRDYISTPTRVLFPPLPREGKPNPDVDPTDEEEETKTKVVKNPISKVSAAGYGSLALSKEGYVYSWGFGGSSQLGLGTDIEVQETPSRVRWKESDKWFVEDISAGGQHCFMLASERSLRLKQLDEFERSVEEVGTSQETAVEEVKVNGVDHKEETVMNGLVQDNEEMDESE